MFPLVATVLIGVMFGVEISWPSAHENAVFAVQSAYAAQEPSHSSDHGAGGSTHSANTGHGASSGGHSSGGHNSDSGHADSGHSDGAKGKGPKFRGGEWARHGTGERHRGHTAGTHATRAHGGTPHSSGADRVFGGGSGLSSLAGVPEGISSPSGLAAGVGHGSGSRSAQYGPQHRFRLRYWGGWTIPQTPSAVAVASSDSDFVPGSGGGSGTGLSALSSARCDDVRGMSAIERVTGRNAMRLGAAVKVVNPKLEGTPRTGFYLLSNAQEELQEDEPDIDLVAVYLGQAAMRLLNLQLVMQVAFELCIDIDEDSANRLAREAESFRRLQHATS